MTLNEEQVEWIVTEVMRRLGVAGAVAKTWGLFQTYGSRSGGPTTRTGGVGSSVRR